MFKYIIFFNNLPNIFLFSDLIIISYEKILKSTPVAATHSAARRGFPVHEDILSRKLLRILTNIICRLRTKKGALHVRYMLPGGRFYETLFF
jgi:hypothetical protein